MPLICGRPAARAIATLASVPQNLALAGDGRVGAIGKDERFAQRVRGGSPGHQRGDQRSHYKFTHHPNHLSECKFARSREARERRHARVRNRQIAECAAGLAPNDQPRDAALDQCGPKPAAVASCRMALERQSNRAVIRISRSGVRPLSPRSDPSAPVPNPARLRGQLREFRARCLANISPYGAACRAASRRERVSRIGAIWVKSRPRHRGRRKNRSPPSSSSDRIIEAVRLERIARARPRPSPASTPRSVTPSDAVVSVLAGGGRIVGIGAWRSSLCILLIHLSCKLALSGTRRRRRDAHKGAWPPPTAIHECWLGSPPCLGNSSLDRHPSSRKALASADAECLRKRPANPAPGSLPRPPPKFQLKSCFVAQDAGFLRSTQQVSRDGDPNSVFLPRHESPGQISVYCLPTLGKFGRWSRRSLMLMSDFDPKHMPRHYS